MIVMVVVVVVVVVVRVVMVWWPVMWPILPTYLLFTYGKLTSTTITIAFGELDGWMMNPALHVLRVAGVRV